MDERKFLLAVIVLGLLFLALWPWHILLAVCLILIGLLLGGVRGWIVLQHHQVDIEAKKRKAVDVFPKPCPPPIPREVRVGIRIGSARSSNPSTKSEPGAT